jgi:hypothetical protein
MSAFLQYLTSIAPEGETILIVKQKPTGGTHGDGAMKCVWPAYLPSKWTPKPDAWYANTAMFIVDRFVDGKVSAGAAYCERVGFLVLDDIGTKSQTPPIEPTWKMETSPGNYQWGYTFALDEQPTKGDFSAAIKAIAVAGFTDAGAINPVRNFRLPGSLNLKPNRDNFASVLVEFHPEREFSLPIICTALDVTPDEADTATLQRIMLKDNGQDDVLAWLASESLIVEAGNAEGWYGVVCPNSASHTDGNPMGRYQPISRAYTCFHEHCSDMRSKEFLCWVEEQGGPKHEHGIRDDLMAKAMDLALSKIQPNEAFPNIAAQIVADVQRKELGRVEKSSWFDRFAYIQDDESYFDLQDRREISRSTFNALFRHIECKSIHNGRRVEASICYDENRQIKGAKALVGVTYAAGDAALAVRDGDVFGNRWRDARPPAGAAGNITMWLDHCVKLVPDDRERNHIFNVMAFKLQNPKIKINHAILHGGDQGIGKDTMWAPFIWSVCGPHNKNCGVIDNHELSAAWGYHLESEIVVLNELREPDAKDRRALANKLKPVIAAPPEMLSINRKGLHPYQMVNRCFVLAFSNDGVPISLDSQDRRWFCVQSIGPQMTTEASSAMWDWYKSGGFEAIAVWLQARDVSKFNPGAVPFMTEFKANLIEHGMSIAESYLVDLVRGKSGEFNRGVVASPFHSLCDRLASGAPSGVKVPQVALLHALKEAGWVDKGRVASADYPTKKHLFCSPDMAGQNKSDLRRMVEVLPALRIAASK